MWIQYVLVGLIVAAAVLFAIWRLPGNATRRRYVAGLRRLGGGRGALHALAGLLEARIERSEAASSAVSPSGTAVTRCPSRSNERVSISRSGRSSSTRRMSRAVVACTAGEVRGWA